MLDYFLSSVLGECPELPDLGKHYMTGMSSSAASRRYPNCRKRLVSAESQIFCLTSFMQFIAAAITLHVRPHHTLHPKSPDQESLPSCAHCAD